MKELGGVVGVRGGVLWRGAKTRASVGGCGGGVLHLTWEVLCWGAEIR